MTIPALKQMRPGDTLYWLVERLMTKSWVTAYRTEDSLAALQQYTNAVARSPNEGWRLVRVEFHSSNKPSMVP